MVKCFVCNSSAGIRFKVKVLKWIERYDRQFCSFACFQKWFRKNSKSLNDFAEPPTDGGKYIEKCFYPEPDEFHRIVKRKHKHG